MFANGGTNYGAQVVQQVCANGWVWAQRMARQSNNPAPACLCIPMGSGAQAGAAQWLLHRQGWKCWARPGKRAGGAAEIKLVVPAGWSLAQVREVLTWLGP